MKDLFFAADLLAVLRHDKYYGIARNVSHALGKFGLASLVRSDDSEQTRHALVVHIMDQRGESEPFLAGSFITPKAIIKLLQEHNLPAPGALQPPGTKDSRGETLDQAQIDRYFDIVCRNCGTVTDPLANAYRTPIGRLVFKTFLAIRHSLGITTTAQYVLGHLKDYDSEKIVTAINADSVTWRADASKEKLTSVETIARFILNFNRELEPLL